MVKLKADQVGGWDRDNLAGFIAAGRRNSAFFSKMKHTVSMDTLADTVSGEDDEDGNTYDHHPAAHTRVDDVWRDDEAEVSGAVRTVPKGLVLPRTADYVGPDPARPLSCHECGAFRTVSARKGKCTRLQRPGAKPGTLATVHALGYCTLFRHKRAGAPLTRKGDFVTPGELLRKTNTMSRLPQVTPHHGSTPREETPAMPDFQEIYYQPDSDERKKREREQGRIRRRADSARNTAKYGFHGIAPQGDPEIRWEPDVNPVEHAGPKLGNRKPTVRADIDEDRIYAGSGYEEDEDDDEDDDDSPDDDERGRVDRKRGY